MKDPMENSKVTIEEIAERAGVSITTVSRVLNGKKDVSAATREKIKRIMKEHDYLPTFSAQTLASKKTNTIGIVIPRSARYIFSNPHSMEMLRGITETLSRFDYDFLLILNKEKRYSQFFKERRIDGLIFLINRYEDPFIQELVEQKYPFVTIGRLRDSEAMTFIDTNSLRSSYLVTEYLIKLGHRRIGYIGGPLDYTTGLRRFEGFKLALEEYRVPYEESWVKFAANSLQEEGRELAEALLGQETMPSAVVCFNDLMAVGAMGAFQKAGKKIPDDLSLISFDNTYLAEYANPPLSSLAQPGYELGRKGSELLLDILDGKQNVSKPVQIILPVELVVRQSTAAPPATI